MATNPNPQLSAGYVSSAAVQNDPGLAAAAPRIAFDGQGPAPRGQTGSNRRVAPDAVNPKMPSDLAETRYLAPASFLSQVPGPSTGSIDQIIAGYMTGSAAPSTSTSGVLVNFPAPSSQDAPRADHPTTTVSPSVDMAIAAFKRSADDSAGLSLAATMTQSFNSSMKRLTQGQ